MNLPERARETAEKMGQGKNYAIILSTLNEAVKDKDEALKEIRGWLYHKNDLEITDNLRLKLKAIAQQALKG